MGEKRPKYWFDLLETPTDVEISRRNHTKNVSSSSLATDQASGSSRRQNPRNHTTPIPRRDNRRRSHQTPGSSSSACGRTPRGHNTPNKPYSASSAVSNDNCSSTIIAIVEGRGNAQGEIGISAFDLKIPVLTLSQFADGQTYAKTLTKLQTVNPLEIILPNTLIEAGTNNKLYTLINKRLPNVTISAVQRRYFNETKGLQHIKHMCADEYKAIELQITSKYYCLAATAALLKYVEFVQNILVAPKSLKVIFKGCEHATMIDSTTVKALELIQNLQNPMNQQHTLYGVLNYTKTPGGGRVLRSNILEPPNDEETIVERHSVLSELTEKEDIFFSLQSVISRFPDIGHVVSVCVQIPKHESVHTAETKIMCVILLKHILQLTIPLKENLSNCETNLLKTYYQLLDDPGYQLILDQINEVITEETHYSKGILQQQIAKYVLDIARRTHTELLGDLEEYVQQLGEHHHLPLRSAFSNLRGHHIQVPSSAVTNKTQDSLPHEFIKVSKTKNTMSFTTMELMQLNERLRRIKDEVYLNANVVVSELIANIREHISCLYKLSDIISMVDMLLALAHAATLSSYICPEFTDTLAVKQSYHPILQKVNTDNTVPNDIYAAEHSNFVIITGPNMGGKSIYLRQVALLQIMAQIGSFVPAQYASFRIADQIFSRIGSDDDMESNSSTFTLEMKETAYILKNHTDKALIIIDELGRGTSPEEGVGICWAIAEAILKTKAFTFFVTHFMQLTELKEYYPNVENYFFEVQRVFNSDSRSENFIFSHILTRGITRETHYGLQLAEMSSLPVSVVEDAKAIAASLDCMRQKNKPKNGELMKRHASFTLATKLIQVANNSRMDEDSLKSYLKHLRNNYEEEIGKANEAISSNAETSDTEFTLES